MMTTQGVVTPQNAINLLSNASSQVSVKGGKEKSSFDLFMGKSINLGQTVKEKTLAVNDSSVKEVSTTKNQDNNSANAKVTDKTMSAKSDNKSITNTTSSDDKKVADNVDPNNEGKATEVSKTDQTSDTKTDNQTQDPELVSQIASMINAIGEAVMKVLNLTPEEMNQLLTEQGMTSVDLLDPQNVTKLFMAKNGLTDISAVLTDENLANTMKQILQQVDQIKAEAAIPFNDEQLKEILEQSQTGSMDNNIVAQQDTVEKMVQKDNKAINSNQAEVSVGKEQSSPVKEVTVEVTKLSDTNGSNASAQSNTSDSNSGETSPSDSFQVFVDNLVKSTQNTQPDSSFANTQVTQIKEIANQIIDRIKVLVKPEQTSMELQLNPEHLGKVSLSVHSKDGVMTAQFVVQNEISKEAIESQLNTLKETLNQQGIKVNAIEVTVAGYAFDQNRQTDTNDQSSDQKGQSKKKLSIEDAISIEDEPIEDAAESRDITGITGSSIDYTA